MRMFESIPRVTGLQIPGVVIIRGFRERTWRGSQGQCLGKILGQVHRQCELEEEKAMA